MKIKISHKRELNLTKPEPEYHYIYCGAYDFSEHAVKCSNGNTSVVTCSGKKSRFEIACPITYISQTSCTIFGYESISGCHTLQSSSKYTLCECDICEVVIKASKPFQNDLRYLTSQDSSVGDSEFFAMAQYAITDFVLVNQEMDRIWAGSTYTSTFSVLVHMFVIWSLLLLSFLFFEKYHQMQETKKLTKVVESCQGLHNSVLPIVKDYDSNLRSYESLEKREKDVLFSSCFMKYIANLCPTLYKPQDVTWNSVCFNEMKNEYLITRVLREPKRKLRFILYFELFTMINMSLYVTAIINGLDMQEDDGRCIHFKREETCLKERSIYDMSVSKCNWNDDMEYCEYIEVEGFNLYLNLVTLLVTIIIVSPLQIILTILFKSILCAPTSVYEGIRCNANVSNIS